MQAQLVAGGHVLAGAESEAADLDLRLDMLAQDGQDVVPGEGLLGEHERRPAGVALLARLEEPEDRAAEVGCSGEPLQHAVEYGGVDVVSAGVHDARVARAPRQTGLLVDGQGVDVGAQHHGPPVGCRTSRDAGQDAGCGDGAVFDAQLREPGGDECRGLMLPEREFGMGMQVAAKFDGVHCQKTVLAISMMFSALPMG